MSRFQCCGLNCCVLFWNPCCKMLTNCSLILLFFFWFWLRHTTAATADSNRHSLLSWQCEGTLTFINCIHFKNYTQFLYELSCGPCWNIRLKLKHAVCSGPISLSKCQISLVLFCFCGFVMFWVALSALFSHFCFFMGFVFFNLFIKVFLSPCLVSCVLGPPPQTPESTDSSLFSFTVSFGV